MNEIDKLRQSQKVILIVLGVVDELKERGLIGGGGRATTMKGVAGFDQLVASGFRPTLDEIRHVVNHVLGIKGTQEVEALQAVIVSYLDGTLDEKLTKLGVDPDKRIT